MIEVKIVADSISTAGKRITTFMLSYPRFIHSEFMTHRLFSRNASSSRAIPVKRMIDTVLESPAMPEYYGAAQKGMAADAEMSAADIAEFKADIELMRNYCAGVATKWRSRAHKQILNRYLEPWAHITVLVTATEWGNFFNLRAHKKAQPEIRVLAVEMLKCLVASRPKPVPVMEWHLPFSDDRLPDGWANIDIKNKLKICTARAARTSYLNFDGEIDVQKDIELHDGLASEGHWSPFEHCAQALPIGSMSSGNFVGWAQYRKKFPEENKRAFNAKELLAEWGIEV